MKDVEGNCPELNSEISAAVLYNETFKRVIHMIIILSETERTKRR